MGKIMNILVIDDEWPSLYSGKFLRIENIWRNLAKGNNVHFLHIGWDPGYREKKNVAILEKIFISVDSFIPQHSKYLLCKIRNILFFKPSGYIRWNDYNDYIQAKRYIQNIINKKAIDVIHVYSCYTAQYVADIDNVIKIWDLCDSYYLSRKREIIFEKSPFYFKKLVCARKFYNYEREMIDKFSRTIFVSPIDAGVHSSFKEKITVIPNGVNLEYYNRKNINENNRTIIFTGHMEFSPNIKAVKYFVKKIFPLIKNSIPDVKFYVVGADPGEEITSLSNDDIIVTGKVDDIYSYLEKSSVFVSPMVSGTGIKNKVLQAMAMAKAIVSTPLGVEALPVTDGYEIFIADKPEIFAHNVIKLLEDRELRAKIGNNARRKVEKEYGWEIAIMKYKAMYNDVYSKAK